MSKIFVWSIITTQTCENSMIPSQVIFHTIKYSHTPIIASSNLFCTHNIVMNYILDRNNVNAIRHQRAKYCKLYSIVK